MGGDNKMINRNEIALNSSFGRIVSNMFLSHGEGSKNIAILFPGGDNSTDVPTLHYARKAALLSGCDVLSLEYGYTINYSTLSQPEIMDTVTGECYEVIKRCLKREYERIFLISKSMGHFISLRIAEQLDIKNIKHICYTPIDAHVSNIVKNECIVFTGTKDKWLTKDGRNELAKYSKIDLIQVENAVHSLEVDDNFKQSIRILEYITDKCSDFIKSNMVV
jgi:predicted alpha/beta-hydrolase family hydrolase